MARRYLVKATLFYLLDYVTSTESVQISDRPKINNKYEDNDNSMGNA